MAESLTFEIINCVHMLTNCMGEKYGFSNNYTIAVIRARVWVMRSEC